MNSISITPSLLLSTRSRRRRRLTAALGRTLLFGVTAVSAGAVILIIGFIVRDAAPFVRLCGVREFFCSTQWYPAGTPAAFGALAIFYGTALVTVSAALIAVPVGIAAAVCLSEMLPFSARQAVKPVVEILAAIPSVVYGFFALVVVAPLLQTHGNYLLAGLVVIVGIPLGGGVVLLTGTLLGRGAARGRGAQMWLLGGVTVLVATLLLAALWRCLQVQVDSGTNALNVAMILAIMALPTIVSVAEDALQAVGRDLREGSYALGASRAQTTLHVVLPAATSGLIAAIILGVMRAVGETMVVWMASGNAAQIPTPWFNLMAPVRTLTATIAGDMGEADQVTGSARYHVLFFMALCLLLIALICNIVSEIVIWRKHKALG
jgi:phosphate transport system permease protein